jgi:hypothetical protein
MYVREGRRLVGQKVMTQSDVQSVAAIPDSIGVGQWGIDCHQCGIFGGEHQGAPAVIADGYVTTGTKYYPIPFGTILPLESEVANLAVTCCLSASHIGFASIRVEPVFMILGEAAGTAAALAVNNKVDITAVDVTQLQTVLLANKGILSS